MIIIIINVKAAISRYGSQLVLEYSKQKGRIRLYTNNLSYSLFTPNEPEINDNFTRVSLNLPDMWTTDIADMLQLNTYLLIR